MNSISKNHEKPHYIHTPKKRSKYVKSYEGYARPSDRFFENEVKKFEEEMRTNKIFDDYVSKNEK